MHELAADDITTEYITNDVGHAINLRLCMIHKNVIL